MCLYIKDRNPAHYPAESSTERVTFIFCGTSHTLYLNKNILSDESLKIIETIRTNILNENEFADIRNCWDELPQHDM